MTLEVTYGTGEDTATVTCKKVTRDQHGVYLIDAHDREVGFIPYRTLEDISPAGSESESGSQSESESESESESQSESESESESESQSESHSESE